MTQKILGYLSNDDSLTSTAIAQIAQEITLDPELISGVGISWIQQDRVLERKNPQLTSGGNDFLGMIAELSARALVAGAYEEILPNVKAMGPHRFQKWIYAEGMLDSEQQRSDDETLHACLERLPDFLRRSVPEESDASVRFFDYLHRLFQKDIYHAAAARREAAARALGESVMAMHHDPAAPFHAIAMTDKLMVACAVGEPLYYRLFSGIEQPAPAPLFVGERTRPTPHPHFRAAIVASLDAPPAAPWQRLEPGHVLCIEEGWKVKKLAMSPSESDR